MKGWGSWAGMGVKQKKVDPQEELRKKLELIVSINSLNMLSFFILIIFKLKKLY